MPLHTIEFAGLLAWAIATGALATHPSSTRNWAAMPPSFVIDFGALVLLGPSAAVVVALAGLTTRYVVARGSAEPLQQVVLNAATVLIATALAGAAYDGLGGTRGNFVWPAQALPIAVAVVAYCFIKSAAVEVVAPLATRHAVEPSWPMSVLRGCPAYVIGASVAVGVVEVIGHRVMWGALPVAAVPIYLAYRAYCVHVNRSEEDQRRREVMDSLNHGMSFIDTQGRVTLWSDALEHLLGCARERALSNSLTGAVPLLAKTELPKAIADAQASQTPRTVLVAMPLAAGSRVLQVRALPVPGGMTLIWDDVTERAAAERALRRREERLALAAEAANDGLWEWDLRTQEFYVSTRWRAMLGLAASSDIAGPDEWIGRVHPDDVVALKQALDAYLTGKTETFQHEHRVRHEDGFYRRYLCRGLAARGAARKAVRIAGSLTDINDRAVVQESLKTAGFLDPLTGVCNRAIFVEKLGRRLDEYKAQPAASRFAVLYLDLDRFKVVNDSLGHMVGDELLTAVSRRLESCLRQGDSLARLGGDEFAILLNGLDDEGQANAIAFRIQKALSASFPIGGREVFTSASIGIAFGRAQYNNPDEIMRDADTAMYHAKSRGKARHEVFDADMHAKALDRLGLENDLRHAVNSNDFEVHYQPIVSLSSGMCVGFESLIRWTRNGESISPATFIPMAEELGLIEQVGTWVLNRACATFADWQRRFPNAGLDTITVNVSSRQLMQQNFLSLVEQAVHNSGLKPCDLRLEITETALMDSPHVAAELLRELRDFGVKIYLDDFGTGYSSLSHLHKLPVDALKIDRSFVRSLLLPDRPAIVESILALARTLNTSVVAEGIESEVQARELERLGCTHAQGYVFSRPLSASAAEQVIAANEPLGPKKVRPEASVDPETYYVSKPFEWPEHVAARAEPVPVPAAASRA